VTTDIPPGSIAAGAPAKVLRAIQLASPDVDQAPTAAG
jgi:acetyltransferase-like isoleucine patch superfamily enzyme